MPRIFLSYRRDDSQGYAGRVYDRLRHEFGPENLFMDIDTILPGDDFVDTINRTLSECDTVLAVVGPRWLTSVDEANQPRLEDELDFVRLEIQTALERKIRVIPVLVGRASMPRSEQLPVPLRTLLRRQAIELSDTRWEYDIGRLVQSLRGASGGTAVVQPGPPSHHEPPVSGPPRVEYPPVYRAAGPLIPTRSSGSISLDLNQTRIMTLDTVNWLPTSIQVSSDNRHIAFAQKRPGFLGIGNKFAINMNGRLSEEFSNVSLEMAFSPNGARLAYGAQNAGGWALVCDGQMGRTYDGMMEGAPVFSPDSHHVLWCVRRGTKWFAMRDGSEGNGHDGLMKDGYVFSPDSRRFAYGAQDSGRWTMVVDERADRQYDGLGGSAIFSRDGAHVGYCALKGSHWVVALDGGESDAYERILSSALVFSPDGQRAAFMALRANEWTLVLDGREGPRYEEILSFPPVFSPDSRHVAYCVKDGDRGVAMRDQAELGSYEGIHSYGMVFSPDSRRLAYAALLEGKWYVVVDGQKSGACDGLMNPGIIFSPDSQHYALGAQVGEKWCVFVDGKPGPLHEKLVHDDLAFSPDSKHLAYYAVDGNQWFIVVDETMTKLPGPTVKGSVLTFTSNDSLRALCISGSDVLMVETVIR